MKYKVNKIIFIFCLNFYSIYSGKAQIAEETPFLSVLSSTDGENIMLRWMVSDYPQWQAGNQDGYRIERYITHKNGAEQNSVLVYQSKVVLENALLPLSEGQWATQFSNNKFAQLAKGALYQEDATVVISDAPTLADAVNQENSKDTRFLFALFAAEQDFQVAKGMALGYLDSNLDPNNTYAYKIILNNSTPTIENMTAISLADVPTLAAPTGLDGRSADKEVVIKWKQPNDEQVYSTFDVERSIDGVNFEKANDLPFVYSSDIEEGSKDAEYSFYKDSLDNNETTYHYRVRGRTPFGTLSQASEVIQLKGRPARLLLSIAINDHQVTEEKVNLKWDNFDQSFANDVAGFNILRSTDSRLHFEKINENLLSPNSRDYTDNNPIPTAYYKVELIDKNDYDYPSPAQLVQLPDSEPPAIPLALSGKFITSHQVQLTWKANEEPDLKGYRLFVSNKRNSTYTQITSRAVLNEEFVYDIDPQFMVDSIFFTILSTDKRENYSKRSAPLALARPDKIAPSDPTLFKAVPTPAGIEIAWKFSSSADVDRHELQRKPSNAPGWETLLNIDPENESNFHNNLTPNSITSTCFIDSTSLRIREYDYRLLAFDESNNASSSKVLSIRPYDSGKRGDIENFALKTIETTIGDVDQQDAYIHLMGMLNQYESTGYITKSEINALVIYQVITPAERIGFLTGPYNPQALYNFLKQRKLDFWGNNIVSQIELTWDYNYLRQLKDFQLFRSAEGSAMMLYKTLNIANLTENDYSFIDEDVKSGKRYFYQIMARHLNDGFSPRSKILMIKLPTY